MSGWGLEQTEVLDSSPQALSRKCRESDQPDTPPERQPVSMVKGPAPQTTRSQQHRALPPAQEPPGQGAPTPMRDLGKDPWLFLASVSLAAQHRGPWRGHWDAPGGIPHLTDKKLHGKLANAAQSVNTS